MPDTDQPHFDNDPGDGSRVAVITDDLHVTLSPLGVVTVTSFTGTATLDFDDIVDVAGVLAEAVRILRDRGHRRVGEVFG